MRPIVARISVSAQIASVCYRKRRRTWRRRKAEAEDSEKARR